jgi:WD40 repeat protein
VPELRFPSLGEAEVCAADEPGRFFAHECVHRGHQNAVSAVCMLQGRAFSAGFDYAIAAWPRLDPSHQLQGQTVGPLSLQTVFARRVHALESLGTSLLVAAGCCPHIKILAANKGLATVSSINALENNTKSILAASARTLISAGGSGVVKLWDIETKTLAKEYPEHRSCVNAIGQMMPSIFVTGSEDGNARLCDIRLNKSVMCFEHREGVKAVLVWDGFSFYAAADGIFVRDI